MSIFFLPAVLSQQEIVAAVEVQAAADEIALKARRAVVIGEDRHVLGLRFVQRFGGAQRRAAPPAFGDARVAGLGHRAGAEIGGDEQRVPIDPGNPAFRHRHVETLFDEAFGNQIEFADFGGVTAVRRQLHQAITVFRRQRLRALINPILALRLAQRIDIQHRLPGRFGLAVLVQRGASQQATRVGLILPEVVIVLAAFAHPRDLGVFIEDIQDFALNALKVFALAETCHGALIFLLHPLQRFFYPAALPATGIHRRRPRRPPPPSPGGYCWVMKSSRIRLLRFAH